MSIIEEDILLNALLVALLTVKFEARPEDIGEVAASPLVAEVCNRVLEALVEAERANGNFGTAQNIKDWHSAVNLSVNQAVLAHIRLSWSYWEKCEQKEKEEFVRILFSPYKATSDVINSIISQAKQP